MVSATGLDSIHSLMMLCLPGIPNCRYIAQIIMIFEHVTLSVL